MLKRYTFGSETYLTLQRIKNLMIERGAAFPATDPKVLREQRKQRGVTLRERRKANGVDKIRLSARFERVPKNETGSTICSSGRFK